MKEPKFNVGDVLYDAFTYAEPEKREFNNYIAVPAMTIVTKIEIDKKTITYHVKEYLKMDNEIKERERIVDEKKMGKHKTRQIVLDVLAEKYDKAFSELQAKVDKDRLKEVLHGE